jgi:hypothetical protein
LYFREKLKQNIDGTDYKWAELQTSIDQDRNGPYAAIKPLFEKQKKIYEQEKQQRKLQNAKKRQAKGDQGIKLQKAIVLKAMFEFAPPYQLTQGELRYLYQVSKQNWVSLSTTTSGSFFELDPDKESNLLKYILEGDSWKKAVTLQWRELEERVCAFLKRLSEKPVPAVETDVFNYIKLIYYKRSGPPSETGGFLTDASVEALRRQTRIQGFLETKCEKAAKGVDSVGDAVDGGGSGSEDDDVLETIGPLRPVADDEVPLVPLPDVGGGGDGDSGSDDYYPFELEPLEADGNGLTPPDLPPLPPPPLQDEDAAGSGDDAEVENLFGEDSDDDDMEL